MKLSWDMDQKTHNGLLTTTICGIWFTNKKLALQPGNGKLLTQQTMKIVPTENWNEANN
jgi:hypothetical protein